MNRGLRIDYLLVTDSLTKRITDVHMDRDARTRDKPSDHVPVMMTLQ